MQRQARACITVGVVVNYNTIRARHGQLGYKMRVMNRILLTMVAALVWMFAGLSVASGPLVNRAITPASLDATAAVPDR